MKGATQRWVFAVLVGLGLAAAGAARADDAEIKVTDRDRVYRNFTREAAVVDPQQIRVEVRGMHMEEDTENHDATAPPRCRGTNSGNCDRLDLQGQRLLGVESLTGGVLDLLLSYGLAQGTEIGAVVPVYVETVHRDDGTSQTAEGIGDITLYGKFKYVFDEQWSVAGGLELTPPTGSDHKIVTIKGSTDKDLDSGNVSGFGTGALGMNPFVSARYSWSVLAAETHLGYNFYTSSNVENVLNWSMAGIIRGGALWAFRAEISGRTWNQFGTRWNDVVCLPGIDFNLTDNFTIRPTGLANISGTAMDWGIGLGVAGVF